DGAAEPAVVRGAVVHGRPAVVGAGLALVDLLVGAADVVDEDAAGPRLHRETKRAAQPQRPDGPVLPPGRAVKRVVLLGGAVRVEAQPFALEGVHLLGRLARGLVTDGHVQLAVLAGVDGAPLVAVLDAAAEFLLVVALE